MDRWTLSGSVGPGQLNDRRDVLIVQKLLNRACQDDPDGSALKEDGLFGPVTRARLAAFQTQTAHLRRADATAKPGGPTMTAMSRFAPHRARGPLVHIVAAPAHVGNGTVRPNDALAAALRKRASRPKASFKSAWINRALPAAISVKGKWGVPIAVTLAQGALESNWGRTAPGNVFFGVKGRAPDGKTVKLATHEVTGGIRHGENDGFRSYDTLEASAEDYGRFLGTNHRYASAFNYRDDPDMFIHLVATAGYATDPSYENKIKSIMAANGLKDFDRKGVSRLVYNDAVNIGVFG